jgi:hypothetical protein
VLGPVLTRYADDLARRPPLAAQRPRSSPV